MSHERICAGGGSADSGHENAAVQLNLSLENGDGENDNKGFTKCSAELLDRSESPDFDLSKESNYDEDPRTPRNLGNRLGNMLDFCRCCRRVHRHAGGGHENEGSTEEHESEESSAESESGSDSSYCSALDYIEFKEPEHSGELDVKDGVHQKTKAEKKLKDVIHMKDNELMSVKKIKKVVTARNLCGCKDPIVMAFRVNKKLLQLSKTYLVNTRTLKALANQVEDFAVQLIDAIESKEEVLIKEECGHADRYASLLSDIADKAITYSQKKFVSHPLMYKRHKMRWNQGLPERLQAGSKLRVFLWLIIVLEFALTPLLLPVIGYAFYKDQLVSQNSEGAQKLSSLIEMYRDYFTTPVVIFAKDKFSQVVFIVLHCRICVLQSTVAVAFEEYLILVYFFGLLLSEYQQYKMSLSEAYFKDLWNYLDLMILVIYAVIIALRIITIVQGGTAYHNRVLEILSYLYGVNTMFLVIRFSSVLELNKVLGPLQLALFRMCIDLLVILLQFGFIILAFSVAITKSYKAELSYMAPNDQPTRNGTRYQTYCEQEAFNCLFQTCRQLVWSVFGLTDLEEMESHTSLTTDIVALLYFMFLVLSVIMLVNMLVALLTTTYDKVKTNSDIEWKFSRAVVESEYRLLHAVVVPFNLISMPFKKLYLTAKKDERKERAKNREKRYQQYYQTELFPRITKRYLKKFGGFFPLSDDENIRLIMEKLKIRPSDKDSFREGKDGHETVAKATDQNDSA